MSLKKRWIIWLVLLTATVAAAIYPLAPDDATPIHKNKVLAHSSPAVIDGSTQGTTGNVIASATTHAHINLPDLKNDPFAAVSWDAAPPEPPPPPPVAPPPVVVAPVVPTEPPLPYQFVGRMQEADGSTQIFLSRGQDSIIAHVGDVLDPNYKLVSMDEHKLTIAYLPMDHLHDISLDTH